MVSIIGTPTSMTGLQPQGSMYPHNITLALSGLDCFNAKLGMVSLAGFVLVSRTLPVSASL